VYGRSNALRGTIQRDVISCVATKLELSSYFELAGLTFLDRESESSSNTPLSMASNDQCCAAQGSMGPWYDKMIQNFHHTCCLQTSSISLLTFLSCRMFLLL